MLCFKACGFEFFQHAAQNSDEAGLWPLVSFYSVTWPVGPGWYDGAPLALGKHASGIEGRVDFIAFLAGDKSPAYLKAGFIGTTEVVPCYITLGGEFCSRLEFLRCAESRVPICCKREIMRSW
jgi:hypothetical protein